LVASLYGVKYRGDKMNGKGLGRNWLWTECGLALHLRVGTEKNEKKSVSIAEFPTEHLPDKSAERYVVLLRTDVVYVTCD
jgi:hypothetical protein